MSLQDRIVDAISAGAVTHAQLLRMLEIQNPGQLDHALGAVLKQGKARYKLGQLTLPNAPPVLRTFDPTAFERLDLGEQKTCPRCLFTVDIEKMLDSGYCKTCHAARERERYHRQKAHIRRRVRKGIACGE